MRAFILFFGLLVGWTLAEASVVEAPLLPPYLGQNPSSVEWRHLTTEHFNLIFPQEFEADARRVAGLLETVYAAEGEGPQVLPRPIDVILQGYSLQSNAFVTLAPRRSEWVLTPMLGPEVGQTEWLATLASHEFRHVVQFEKSRSGFARFLRIILGETGTGLAIGLTLPPWYLEGDAVGMETALSLGGRGRLPMFARDLRTLLLDGQEPNYAQLALGSYQRYIPNHYIVGYHLTTYFRKRFGRDMLERVHRETMEGAYNPLAFFSSIENVTGVPFDRFYQDCLDDLTKLWRHQETKLQVLPARPWDVGKTLGWTQFSYPAPLREADELIAYREGLSHIGQFVLLREGEQPEVLWTPSPLLQDFPFKVRDGKLAISEWDLDPRWGVRDFSRVVVRDAMAGKTLYRSRPSRWMLPVLSHDGRRVAAFDWDPAKAPHLRIISVPDGEILQSVPWERDRPVMGMDWVPGDKHLIVLHKEGLYNLVFTRVTLATQARGEIARTDRWNWAYPAVNRTHIYFQSPASGLDNIHRIALADGKEEQVTSERYGAYHPAIGSEGLYYASYTPEGLRPASVGWSALEKQTKTPGENVMPPLFAPLVDQEGKGDLLSETKPADGKVKPYSWTGHTWNPHSWFFIAPPLGSTAAALVRSTDVLNNVDLVAGGIWDMNEHEAQAFATARLNHWWPLIDVRTAFGGRRNNWSVGGKNYTDKWEEGSVETGVTLPWMALRGRWVLNSKLRGYTSILQAKGMDAASSSDIGEHSMLLPGAEFSTSMTQRQAPRDLLPPWGIQLSGKATIGHDISGADSFNSSQKWLALKPFVPGLAPHHHLYGEVATETRALRGYHFASPMLFSRGFGSKFMEDKNRVSANYVFPISYWEARLSRYLYVKRVSLNIYYDNTWGHMYGARARFESRGAELWNDIHIARNFVPFRLGIRYNVPVGRTSNWDVFLSTSLVEF